MRCALTCMVLVAAIAADAPGQTPAAKTPPNRTDSSNQPRLVKMSVRPAAAPSPALKHRLLPDILDQTPGNAAQYYYIATQNAPKEWPRPVEEATTLSLEQVAAAAEKAEVKSVLASGALRYLELAGKRERCHWDLGIRTEGFSLMLPGLSKYRDLGKLLAFRARLEIARGQYDQAIHTLQTGLALARNIGEGPTLIQSLVATAVASLMLATVDDLIQQPGAPNLYWALTALPQPLMDPRKSVEWEYSLVYLMVPQLRNIETARLTRQQWQAVTDEVARAVAKLTGRRVGSEPAWKEKAALTAMAVYLYPQAKEYLVSIGTAADQVEAMPVQQVIAVYTLGTYAQLRDESLKWFYVPYWQARESIQQSKEALAQARRRFPTNPLIMLLPSLSRAYFMTTRVDRKVAALRCIEAVRMYAASHEGRLPEKLSDVTEVPVPIDPVTGRPFAYKVAGNTITLDAPAPKGERPRDGDRYEVTFLSE